MAVVIGAVKVEQTPAEQLVTVVSTVESWVLVEVVSSLVQPPLQLVMVASSVETLVAVKVALLPYTTDVILLLEVLLEVSLPFLVITEEIKVEEATEAAEAGEEAAEVGLTTEPEAEVTASLDEVTSTEEAVVSAEEAVVSAEVEVDVGKAV